MPRGWHRQPGRYFIIESATRIHFFSSLMSEVVWYMHGILVTILCIEAG